MRQQQQKVNLISQKCRIFGIGNVIENWTEDYSKMLTEISLSKVFIDRLLNRFLVDGFDFFSIDVIMCCLVKINLKLLNF